MAARADAVRGLLAAPVRSGPALESLLRHPRTGWIAQAIDARAPAGGRAAGDLAFGRPGFLHDSALRRAGRQLAPEDVFDFFRGTGIRRNGAHPPHRRTIPDRAPRARFERDV